MILRKGQFYVHFLVILCLYWQISFLQAESLKNKPNIVYFLSDDHRADFLGCAGHPILKTPVLDSLAARGTRFKNAFVTTSICAASRASILTGLHERTHKYTFGTPAINKEFVDTSYPSILRKNGYKTGFVGKFGVNAGNHEMFDFFRPLNRAPYFKKQADGSQKHLTDITGDEAIKFIQGAHKDGPFCLSVSFNAAHAEDGDKENHFPWPSSEDGLYEDITIPAPQNSQKGIYESQPKFLKTSLNRVRYFWRWDTDEKYQKNVKAYYRMITGLDRVIGRVISELEKLGQSQNTVIIFSGDNGYYKGARGFAGKWSHYEESLRVPLIIFDPQVDKSKHGNLPEQIALNIDIPSTILHYANVDIPDHYQGKSLKPLAHGITPKSWRKEFFCEHLMNHAQIPKWEGIRHERFVYANYFQQDADAEFLHDLYNDPQQLNNLVGNEAYTHVLEDLRQLNLQYREELGGAYSIEKFPTRAYLNSLKNKDRK